jgi:transposase InsO family protein
VEIRAIHRSTRKSYGSPRITDDLKEKGERCGRRRVARIMKENELVGKKAKKFKAQTTDSDHDHPVADNVLDRQFNPELPNRFWVSDITYIWTSEGWAYLAATMDLFSRKIVGWEISNHVDDDLTLSALRMGLALRTPGAGLLHHSDRGSQYASGDFQDELTKYGITPSMSRKGNCYDNAVMESFFASLKIEWLEGMRYRTRKEAMQDVAAYIEGFYNTRRRHSSLGGISPAEFERRWNAENGGGLSTIDIVGGSRTNDLALTQGQATLLRSVVN